MIDETRYLRYNLYRNKQGLTDMYVWHFTALT